MSTAPPDEWAAGPAGTDEARRPMALPTGGRASSLGIALAMAADYAVLGAIVAAYFAVKSGAGDWPPDGVDVGTYIPTVVTVTAVLSSFSAQWAVFAARRNDQRNVAIGLGLTAFFGVAILNAEWLALTQAGFGVPSSAYGTFYFLLFGYHLVHVLVAIPLMGMVAGRAVAGHFPPARYDGVRATAILWHSVNGLWYVIVTVLFLLSRHS